MMNYIKAILLVIALVFFITFGVENSYSVKVHYFLDIMYVELPMYGLAYICIVLGIFIGMIIGFRERIKLGKTIRKLQREAEQSKNLFEIEKKSGEEHI